MTTLIDKRGIPLTVTFGDLNIGDYYQDALNNLCLKTSENSCIYYEEYSQTWIHNFESEKELIIPLKATVTIERAN